MRVQVFAVVDMFVLMHGAVDMGVEVGVRQAAESVQKPPDQVSDAEAQQQPAGQFSPMAFEFLEP